MTQTRAGSFVESLGALSAHVWFTAISLVRQHVLRRWFNGLKFGNKVDNQQLAAQNGRGNAQSGQSSTSGYTKSSGHLVQRSIFPTDAGLRNEFPMYDGLLAYFPSALAAVARISKIGNDQHNPGQPMHHARGKSMDHANKIIRHLMEGEGDDIDGTLHADKVAWRALARAQEIHEARGAPLAPGARV